MDLVFQKIRSVPVVHGVKGNKARGGSIEFSEKIRRPLLVLADGHVHHVVLVDDDVIVAREVIKLDDYIDPSERVIRLVDMPLHRGPM
jgi:hypothetical protein